MRETNHAALHASGSSIRTGGHPLLSSMSHATSTDIARASPTAACVDMGDFLDKIAVKAPL
jgi:hypothetical protein